MHMNESISANNSGIATSVTRISNKSSPYVTISVNVPVASSSEARRPRRSGLKAVNIAAPSDSNSCSANFRIGRNISDTISNATWKNRSLIEPPTTMPAATTPWRPSVRALRSRIGMSGRPMLSDKRRPAADDKTSESLATNELLPVLYPSFDE